MMAVAGKYFSDGRVIRVYQSPDWVAVAKQPKFGRPAGWPEMSEVVRAIWCLEHSGKPSVQWGTYRAEWGKSRAF